MNDDGYKIEENNTQIRESKLTKNEKYDLEFNHFLEQFSKTDEHVDINDLNHILRILITKPLEFEESIIESDLFQHLIYEFPSFSTLNEAILCLDIFRLLLEHYSFDIQSVLPEDFFDSLISFFTDEPKEPFIPKFPLSSESLDKTKYEKLLLDIFIILMNKYQCLRDLFDKKFIFDTFSLYLIRTSDFDLFSKACQWIASIIDIENDTFEVTSKLLDVFQLFEPYFNERECRPLLCLAVSFCSISEECVVNFNEVVPICNLFSLLSESFLYVKEFFNLIYVILSRTDVFDDVIFTTFDIDFVMKCLSSMNFIIESKENPTIYIIDVLTYFLENKKYESKLIDNMFVIDIIRVLLDDSPAFLYKTERFSFTIKMFLRLNFERKCLFIEEFGNSFIECIDTVLESGNKSKYKLSLNALLSLHDTFGDNETRFDYNDTRDKVSNIIDELTDESSENTDIITQCELFLNLF